jgi:hypothetical protein
MDDVFEDVGPRDEQIVGVTLGDEPTMRVVMAGSFETAYVGPVAAAVVFTDRFGVNVECTADDARAFGWVDDDGQRQVQTIRRSATR